MELYNTLSRKVEEFKSLNPGKATMYTCGPTVYNFVHLGNLRTFILYDILKRALELNGYKVKHITNLTDVDDKTIKGSMESKVSLKEYTELYTGYFFDDIKKLNIKKASKYPKATESIDEMQKIILGLENKGYAYEAEDGIYYNVKKFENYGKLSGMEANGKYSRIKNDEYDKENIADFALWKYWDENDGDVFWEGKLKKGRPGWHIECSAMSLKYLGETIDIHSGGVDLIFPHHENEIAQSEAYTGKKFVDYWVHGEHLLVNNQKMSKSLGNFYTLRDIEKEGFSPLSFRLMVLDSHYRSKLNFTFESLKKYEKTLGRVDFSIKALEAIEKEDKDNDPFESGRTKESVEKLVNKFKEDINNDLDTHSALKEFFSLLDMIDSKADKGKIYQGDYEVFKEALSKMNSVLGLQSNYKIPKEVKEIAKQRLKERLGKNWQVADSLRDDITAKGFSISDVGDSYVITKRYLE